MGAAAGAAQVGMGAVQILNAKNQADMMKQQAAFEAQQSEFNARLIEFRKQDIQALAEKDIQARHKQVNQMLGAQKVSLAAQGIEVEGELGAQFEQQEREMALEDVQSIKNNAWREAMGLSIQQQNIRSQSRIDQIAAKDKARDTIVTGGIQGVSTMMGGAGKFM